MTLKERYWKFRVRLLHWQLWLRLQYRYANLLLRGKITFAEIRALRRRRSSIRRRAEWEVRTRNNYWGKL